MCRARRRRDDGAAAVEFALIASLVLLPLLFGILQYGFYFFQATSAEHAAREGARLAAIGTGDCASWEAAVEARATGVEVTGISLSAGAARGDSITVSMTWVPAIDLPLVPFIPDSVLEQATTRVERIGPLTGGCS
jgi:Flp pilus assembly protein TadG